MLAQLSMWIVVATLGQAPAGEASPAWLKAIPGDIDVVIRGRGLEPTLTDLTDMLKAMSPRGAEQAAPALANLLTQFQNQHGAEAIKTPWVSLGRVVPPGPDGVMPFAVLVMQQDYRDTLKALAGGKEVALKAEDGGFDSFDNPHGEGLWFAVKGAGFVAFGPDKKLIAAIARPGEKTLDAVLTPALTTSLLAGDLGLFVNAAQLSTRYAGQIDQARREFMAGIDKSARLNPAAPSMDFVKDLYGGLFDSIKEADLLVLNLDVAADGLRLAGQLEVKPGADPAQPIGSRKSVAANLANFPSDAAFYVSMSMDAKVMEKWQNMSLRMLNPTGKLSPEMTRAMEQFHNLGRLDSSGALTIAKGMRGINVTNTSDPKSYIAASEAMLKAMTGGENPLNLYKDVKVEANAKTYEDLSFSHVVATFDDEKLAKLGAPNNGGGAAGVKAMFGDGAISYWIAADDKRVIQVTTPTWEEAKAQLDTFMKGDARIGTVPAFRAVRSALGDPADFLMIINAQGLVRMMAAQLGATLNRPELKEPAGLPKEPAFFGLSLAPRQPAGYEFRFVLPSQVVPVFENGMIPLFQQMQPPQVQPPQVQPPQVDQ